MIRSLYISKTGLDAQQTNLDTIANNLANVSTNGFKRSRAVFEDLLYQTVRQPGAQSSRATPIALVPRSELDALLHCVASARGSSPAGMPSTIVVSPGPWDSPAVTKSKRAIGAER